MTNRRRVTTFIAALSACATPAFAQLPIRSLAGGEDSPPASIEDVAWFEGHWRSDNAEEMYAAPVDGQIMGMYRISSGGALQLYEFILITERDGSLVLSLKHIQPDLTVWEEKDEWTEFPLVAIEGKTAYFDGITYAREGDQLTSSVAAGENGSILTFEFELAE